MIERDTGLIFQLGNTTWTCWAKDGGSYEWLSDCGRLVAWRDGAHWVSTIDGHLTPQPHPTLRAAMRDAQCEILLRDHGFRNWRVQSQEIQRAANSEALRQFGFTRWDELPPSILDGAA